MKKILFCALLCTGVCCSSAFAECNIEKNNCEYTVTSDCEPGETVTMIVGKAGSLFEDSDIVAVWEGKSESDKIIFEFEFEEDAAYEGKYTIYVTNNGSNTKTGVDFVHASDTSIENAKIALANVNLSDDIIEILKNDSTHRNALEAMGMKLDAYSNCDEDSQRTKIREMFIKEKDSYDDLINLMNCSIGVVMINTDDNIEDALLCAMPEFEEIKFENTDDDLKQWIKELIKGQYSTIEEFNDRYKEICILYMFNNAKFSEFSKLIEKYGEILKITDSYVYKRYNGLSSVNKSKVGDKLFDKLENSPAKTTDELLDKLGYACNEINVQSSEGYSGGGSSSGGSGGSKPQVIASGGNSNNPTPKQEQDKINVSYKDMENVSWAETAVNALTEKGVISGDGEGYFRPNDTVTREEFVKMLISAIDSVDEYAVSDFSDLNEGAWYYKYVSSAYNAGIVSGISDTHFGIGKSITRQEMAVMISRALKIYKEMPSIRENADFTDKDEIAEWAKDDVAALYCTGIMSGVGDGKFEPKNIATRAQAAVVVYNLIK